MPRGPVPPIWLRKYDSHTRVLPGSRIRHGSRRSLVPTPAVAALATVHSWVSGGQVEPPSHERLAISDPCSRAWVMPRRATARIDPSAHRTEVGKPTYLPLDCQTTLAGKPR